ncbi:MAG: hypothetical protein C0483_12680 [Pirellula sp.]|nr:hypothetical protein [Pirellula sp.]
MIRSARLISGTWLCLLAAFACAPAQAADDVSQGIEVLLAVGPEGKGHREAQAAWKTVSTAPAARLPELLAALDTAGPLAANWLRSAVETIADHVPAEEQKNVAGQLEPFVTDAKHVPTARRLAYDVLARFDPTAADRLMPGFLNDPSTELRRESIERLLTQAAASKDEAASKKLQRQAFEAARDLDQIKSLAEKLEKLGEPVDLPSHFGFVMQWKLIGPFDNAGEKGFDVAYPPETEINPAAKYPGKEGKEVGWIDHTTTDKHGVVDLNAALGKSKGAAAYAFAEFRAAKAGPVDIRVGSNNAVKVWINGKLCDSRRVYHAGFEIDQYISRAELSAGENRILVKVCENEQTESWAQDWNFQLRVCDAVGTAVLSADRVAGK